MNGPVGAPVAYYRGAHVSAASTATPIRRPRRLADRAGDLLLSGLTGAAALGAIALVLAIAWKIVDGSRLAFSKFGLGFVTSRVWDPVTSHFGALDFLFGTLYTTALAILIAGPLAIAIGLFLSELAPRGIRGGLGALVEMLAAIPSVVLGLWGILVLGPFLHRTLDPALKHGLGFLPFFRGDIPQSGVGLMPAVIVLTIMSVPIIASISRELFLAVPPELEEGALALGATRWEMVRGVVLPATRAGLAAAVILGMGRALGEAIAVTQVIGGQTGIHLSLFETGDTLASRIAAQYQGAVSNVQVSSLVYLAAILLAITLIANLAAQMIVRRFEFQRTGAD
ncbi:MAG: phosphate transport system permease protein [Gaiellaceae bacterium]|nr:phosphate transport system permease protein [Gaiellaceae bacterium]